MSGKVLLCCLSFVLLASAAASPAGAATKASSSAPAIDPRAEQMLRQMSDYLAGLDHFTVHAYTTLEMITPSDMSLDSDREVDLSVQRPDHVRINSLVPDHDRQMYYNGTTITIYSPGKKLYAVMVAPATIDETIAAARTKGIELPLADLIQSRPYNSLMSGVRHGYYIGKSLVGGILTNHLAFRQKDLDWQIWIEDSSTPVPRRVIITDRALPDTPRYSATLSGWNTSPTFAANQFTFAPPADAQKIDFIATGRR